MRELEVFVESSRFVASTLDLGEVLDRLAGIARARLGVDVVRIWLREEAPGDLILRAETGTRRQDVAFQTRLASSEGLAGVVIATGEPIFICDVLGDPRLKNRVWFEAEGLVSMMLVPIVLGMDRIGILACATRSRREFSPGDVALAAAVAAPAAQAVRNAGIHAGALARLEEIQAFQRVTAETLASPDLETVLRAIVRETQNLLAADAAVCSLVEPSAQRTGRVVGLGVETEGLPRYRVAPRAGLGGEALAARRPVRTDDYFADARFVRIPEFDSWARAQGIKAMIGTAVIDRDGLALAFLWAFNRSDSLFTATHEERLARLSQQAAVAIEKARGFEEERRRARENASLLEIARTCSTTLDLKPLLSEVSRQAALAVGVERCTVSLWRDGHLGPLMSQFADGRAVPEMWASLKGMRKEGWDRVPAAVEAIRSKQPVAIEDAVGSTLIPASWQEAFRTRAVLVLPLVAKDEVIGVMLLDDTRGPRQWSPSEMDLAVTIAAQVALAVDRSHQYEAATRRAAEVETLSAMGATLASTLDIQAVLEAVADSAVTLIGAQRAAVFELDEAAGLLRARAARGAGIAVGFPVRLGQGAVGAAALTHAPVWSADVLSQPLPGSDLMVEEVGMTFGEAIRGHGYRGILGVPIISRETALGAVCVYWQEPHEPDEREIRLLTALARQAAIAMDNARLVSDLRRTLEDLKAAQDTVVQGATLRAVGELAAGAAHHLNNLMAVVLGRTQLLLMREPPQQMIQSLKTIERAVVDAADTVRRIQVFGRTDRGEALSPEVDLNAVIREGVQLTRPRWEHEAQVKGAGIEVVFEPGPLPNISGRAAEFREVITSLILNAVDAMPKGGRIHIRTMRDGDRAVVSVQDSGVGMSSEVKRRVFEPFYTTKGVKSTGLGLAVAYGTVRSRGGDITVESTEAQGTTVSFWVPLGPAAQAAPAAAATPARTGAVLVIDDEDSVRELVADVLASEGHRVMTASGGREGLERFEAGQFDLVLTDLGMPDMTGWDVVRGVRARRPETPVLLVTGQGEVVEMPADVRVDGLISKPFDVAKLAAAVSEALARR
ncbi:MAG: GAF domain-containing protein [Candidatus Rokubacteria bacterium]|nr:GAF domain-containing protein [Candidatus Rokubacteria bacterium]